MNPSTREKLLQVVDRHEELNVLLTDPDIISDQNKFRKLSIELSELLPVVESFNEYEKLDEEIQEAKTMMDDEDSAIREMAKEELPGLEQRMETCQEKLQKQLLPKDPNEFKKYFCGDTGRNRW